MSRDASAATFADAGPEVPQRAGLDLEILNASVGYMLRRAQLAVFADFGETFVQLNLRPGQFAALTVIDRNHGIHPHGRDRHRHVVDRAAIDARATVHPAWRKESW